MLSGEVRITGGRDTVVFGRDGFVLAGLDAGAARLSGEHTAGRTVVLSGYILPAGETAAARFSEMERLTRRLCRIVAGSGGFTLSVGGRQIRLIADSAPVFASEAPLNGDEASYFTVTASAAVPSAAYFYGEEAAVTGYGWEGRLVFPHAVTKETVFAEGARSGEITVYHKGDAPCGFVLTVTAAFQAIAGFTITSGRGEKLSVARPIPLGESVVIDTRPGEKTVTAGGESAIGDLSFDSEFFSLMPGENRLFWQTAGDGTAEMRVEFSPPFH